MRRALLTTTIVFFLFALSHATEIPTRETGQILFHSKTIGSSGRSCSSCHPKGKGLQDVKNWDEDMLKDQVNDCIRNALLGEPLDPDSTEMNSLILYLQSL